MAITIRKTNTNKRMNVRRVFDIREEETERGSCVRQRSGDGEESKDSRDGERRVEKGREGAGSGQAAPPPSPPQIVYATVAAADDDDGPVVTMYVVGRSPSLPPYSVPRYRVPGRRYCSTAERTDGEREGPDTHGTHSLTRAYVTSRYTNCGIQRAWNAARTWNNASRRRPSADMQAALPFHSSISYERDEGAQIPPFRMRLRIFRAEMVSP